MSRLLSSSRHRPRIFGTSDINSGSVVSATLNLLLGFVRMRVATTDPAGIRRVFTVENTRWCIGNNSLSRFHPGKTFARVFFRHLPSTEEKLVLVLLTRHAGPKMTLLIAVSVYITRPPRSACLNSARRRHSKRCTRVGVCFTELVRPLTAARTKPYALLTLPFACECSLFVRSPLPPAPLF